MEQEQVAVSREASGHSLAAGHWVPSGANLSKPCWGHSALQPPWWTVHLPSWAGGCGGGSSSPCLLSMPCTPAHVPSMGSHQCSAWRPGLPLAPVHSPSLDTRSVPRAPWPGTWPCLGPTSWRESACIPDCHPGHVQAESEGGGHRGAGHRGPSLPASLAPSRGEGPASVKRVDSSTATVRAGLARKGGGVGALWEKGGAQRPWPPFFPPQNPLPF